MNIFEVDKHLLEVAPHEQVRDALINCMKGNLPSGYLFAPAAALSISLRRVLKELPNRESAEAGQFILNFAKALASNSRKAGEVIHLMKQPVIQAVPRTNLATSAAARGFHMLSTFVQDSIPRMDIVEMVVVLLEDEAAINQNLGAMRSETLSLLLRTLNVFPSGGEMRDTVHMSSVVFSSTGYMSKSYMGSPDGAASVTLMPYQGPKHRESILAYVRLAPRVKKVRHAVGAALARRSRGQ